MTSPSRPDPEVICRMCKYHYRRSLMHITERGYHCVDRKKCNGNVLVRERMVRR